MIELNIWADFIADKLELPYPDYKIRLTDFLEDNDWFGIETIWKDGALYIHKTDADMICYVGKDILSSVLSAIE